MSYVSPSGVGDAVDAGDYVADINSKFDLIQSALDAIQGEISGVGSQLAQSGVRQMAWLAKALGQNGIVGLDDLSLVWSTDHETLTQTLPNNSSLFVLDGQVYELRSARTFDLTSLFVWSGSRNVSLVIRPRGAPSCELLFVETTDVAATDLELFRGSYSIVGPVYTMSDWRVMARVLMDAAHYEDVAERRVPLTVALSDTLPTTGTEYLKIPIVVPFDCEVDHAYVHLANPPVGAGATYQIKLEDSAGSNVLSNLAQFVEGSSNVTRSLTAASPRVQLVAGSYIRVKCDVLVGSFSSGGSGLSITLSVVPVDHEIL